ncbi:MAG: hypothetical protein PHO02_00770 [Candidatus Nanoarchaeia archaeon]|nr:hypothetical protein [Candidatus Nanoarchaeia archaeon]
MAIASYSGRKLDDIVDKIGGRDDVLIHDVKSATSLVSINKDDPNSCYWIEAFHYLLVPLIPAYSADKLNIQLFDIAEETSPDYSIYSKEKRSGLQVGKLFFFSDAMEAPFGEAKYEWCVVNLLPSKALADSFLVSSCYSEIQRSIEIPKRDILLDKAKTMGRKALRLKY